MKFKPTLREVEKIDLYAYIHGIIRKIQDEKHYPYRNCLNCQHFVEVDENCKRWGMKPPARVICYGCSDHEDIETIPF